MKKRKKLKGMTLIEVLISLAVLAMLSVVLLLYGMYVDNTRRATTSLKEKIVSESNYAASKNHNFNSVDEDGNKVLKTFSSGDIDISITVNSKGTYKEITTEADGSKKTVTVDYDHPTEELDANVYDTKSAYKDSGKGKDRGNINLKFVDDIQEATAAATTSASS